ncbi:DUF4229 domain-containing protein [Actinomycetospora chiangmaiensis]|uniref:DUF4229 domain-containing protein n=1 Tax=Actinomycetospora chiangmaiensis TaxID=402650 RepID=UPI0003732315|nr:DUF4229 domain-containing protein [Actinomycetospora chiangmaiensis]
METEEQGSETAGRTGSVVVAVGVYAAVRVLLVVVIAAVLVLVGLPVLVALLIAIVLALPLSLVLFRPLRTRANEAIAAAGATRREQRERLRAELRGDDPAA